MKIVLTFLVVRMVGTGDALIAKDEIVIGAAALDNDGTSLWTTGHGPTDVLYVGDLDPILPGLDRGIGRPKNLADVCDYPCCVDSTNSDLFGG